MRYIIFNLKEEAESFCNLVDKALGFPKQSFAGVAGNLQVPAEGTIIARYATPIKKYNAEKYAYPVTDENMHLVPAEKELIEYLENWYPDGII
jgi:hypothetical protein